MDKLSLRHDEIQKFLSDCQLDNFDNPRTMLISYSKLNLFSEEVLDSWNSSGPNFKSYHSRTFKLLLQLLNTLRDQAARIQICSQFIRKEKFYLMKLVCHVDVSTQILKIGSPIKATFRCLYVDDVNISEPNVHCCVVSDKQISILQGHSDAPEINGNLCVIGTEKLKYEDGKRCATFNELTIDRIHQFYTHSANSFEGKCALFFYTTLSINNQEVDVWTLSHPMVQISHASQERVAEGSIFWVNYFSRQENTVECTGLTLALVHEFNKRVINRPMSDLNIKYIYENLLALAENEFITSQIFLKRVWKLNYSFWEWFYNLMKLLGPRAKNGGDDVTDTSVHAIWEAGLISGFISNEKAAGLLKDQQAGTFLIRFSDANLRAIQITKMTPNGVVDSHEVLHSDLRDQGLARCIYYIDGAEYLLSTFLEDVRNRDEALSPFISN
ncbi:signal transducer and transcription activator-like [Drosophila willistoni]|uniref:signal transducer and transcription activator-like n=1 Tax=Drosophila willistoni TaxID=7260 RepID=UPI000C26D408|nr:signal transducer and transcription activator-like [Drosophila willistoni]XP_046866916.1 signal transducer and transcription activator-like [Drosophila willistoni]